MGLKLHLCVDPGSGQYEDPADAVVAHCQDDLQRLHLLQHAGACGLSSRQNYKSGAKSTYSPFMIYVLRVAVPVRNQ
jgi:hypothetical protein